MASPIGKPSMDRTRSTLRAESIQKQVLDGYDASLVALLKASFDAIVLIDMNGRIRQIFTGAKDFLGYAPAELEGTSAGDLLDSEEASSLLDRLIEQRRHLDGRRAPFEFRVRSRSGSWAVLEAFAVDPLGQPETGAGILLGCRNITERIRRDDHLRTLEKALQTTQIGVTITNLSGQIIYVNRAEAEMHGYSVAELLGKDSHTLAPPNLRRELDQGGIKATWARETENLHRDGSTFPVLLWSDIVTDQAGERIGFVTCSRDIREEKRVEAALRASEARFRGAFENAPIGIALITPDGRHTRVNAAFCDLTGYSANDLLSTNLKDLFCSEDISLADLILDPAPASGVPPGPVEVRLIHSEGHTVWTLCTSSAVPKTEGSPAHLVVQFLNITTRRQALEALHRSEARAAENFAVAPDAIISTNEDHEILLFNRAAEEMFGFRAAEVLGERIQILIPEEVWVDRLEEGLATDTAALSDSLDQRIRLVGIHRDGREVPLEAAVSKGSGGGEELYTLILRDVSERLAAEQALRQAQQALQALVEAAPLAIIASDLDGRITLWNPAAVRIFGWRESEVLGGPDLTVPIRSVSKKSLRTRGGALGPFRRRSLRRRTKSGRWIDVSVEEAELRDADDQVYGYMAIVADRTAERTFERQREQLLEQERAEREIAVAAERRALFLAEAADILDAGFETDLSGTFDSLARLAVPALADCCIVDSVSQNGVLKRVAVAQVNQDDAGGVGGPHGTLVERVLETGRAIIIRNVPVEGEHFMTNAAHAQFLMDIGALSFVARPLIARGRMVGVLTFMRTRASGAYHTDAELGLTEELARRAAITLDNERLFHEAEASARSRDEVLAVVSHDLRNPLSVIQMSLQSTLRSWPPAGRGEAERKQLILADRSAQRMKRLILDLLDAARIETGTLRLDPLPYEVRTLVQEAADLNRPLVEARKIELKVEIPSRVPLVLTDFHRALQVFANLIDNATRHTAPGGRITIGAEEVTGMIKFYVSDTGTGIRPEDLHNLFDRVWRGRRSRPGGAGLGLSIAKGIIEGHGGSIWVQSEPGQGTLVSFSLPTAINSS